jgi:predicted ATPase
VRLLESGKTPYRMRELDRIRLEGFKSTREMDIELRLLNILIGANGAGKSNFIVPAR